MKKLIWTLIIGLALWSCSGNLLNNPLGSVTVSISAGPTHINGVDTMGISWNTNVASRHMVEYGTVSGTYTKASPATSAESMDHLETLIDLVPSTKYFYRITSFYQTSFQKVSQEYSYTTNAFTQPTGITTTPSTTSVTVAWTTSLSAKGSIDLGTNTGVYNLSTPAEATSGTVHTQTISGLLPNTTYFFRLKSQYPNGIIDTHTQETTFTTAAVSLVGIPTAVADQTSVTITWTTDTSVNHGVDYGTAPGVYSHTTVPTTSAFASHSVAIANLAANTTYYYRLKSLLSTGTTVNHTEASFTTGLINLVAEPNIVLSPSDAVFTWSTNVATAYIIETGTATGVYTQSSPKSTTSVMDHSHALANLIANKKYYYRIISYLPSGVNVAHGEGSFTTTNVYFTVNPAVTVTSTSGDISWTTNVLTTYTLEFGLSTGGYTTATPESTPAKTLQTHSLTGLLSNRTYFYRIKSILPTGGVVVHSEGSFATTAVTISGLPGVVTQATSAEIAWTTTEATNYSLDYGTTTGIYTKSLPVSLTAIADHLIVITGLSSSTTYFYKITSHLISGEKITHTEGTFTTLAVTLTLGPTATPGSTTSSIAWTTNIATDSAVDYGTATGTYTLSTPATTSATTGHTHNLTGLSANTLYYYRIRSLLSNGETVVHAEASFTTTAVSITAGPSATPGNTSASLTWTTSSSSKNTVEWGTVTGTYTNATTLSGSFASDQSVTITGLLPATQYFYRIKSYLTTGEIVTHPEGSFTTMAVTLTLGPTATPGSTSSSISWTTNIATNYAIDYGTATGTYTLSTPATTSATTGHTHNLTGLSASTLYYYRIRSLLSNGETVVHAQASFTTSAVSISAGPSATPNNTSASLTWTTSASSKHTVEWGTVTGTYTNATTLSGSFASDQSVTISGLLPATTYFYRIKSYLTTGEIVTHPEGNFTTVAVSFTVSPVATPGSTSASIAWTTNIATSYAIDYGTATGAYTQSTPATTSATTGHTHNITGLSANTLYFYRIRSLLTNGETVVHAEGSFTTNAVTIIVGPWATPTLTSGNLTWTTSVTTKNMVEWGTVTGTYTNATTVTASYITAQSVSLTGLQPSTQYFYRIKSYLSTGEIVTHTEGNFTTTAFGFTVNPSVAGITTTSGDISWTTNLAAKSIVDYGTSTGIYTLSLSIDTSATAAHTRTLSALTPGIMYYYQIRNFTASNGDFTSGESTFTTTAEVEPTLAKKRRGIWMVGGLSGSQISNVVNSLDLFDPVTETWYAGAGSVIGYTPVSFAGIAAVSDKIYVIGGFNAAGTAVSTVQVYSITSDMWTTGTSMPSARANIQATYSNGKIYILGGTEGIFSDAFAGSTTNYEYNLAGNVWNSRAIYGGANSERYSYAMNDVIYNLGGRLTATAVTASAHDAYVPAYNALSGVTEVVMDTNRSGLAGDIYIPSAGPAITILIGGVTTFVGTTGNFVNHGTTTPTLSNLMQYLAYPLATPSSWTIPSSGPTTYPSLIAFGSAVISTKVTPPMLYYFGGVTSLGTTTTLVSGGYKCNVPSHPSWEGTWTAYPNAPTARWGHSAVTLNN